MSRVMDAKEEYHLVKCRNLAGGCYDAPSTLSVSICFSFLRASKETKPKNRKKRCLKCLIYSSFAIDCFVCFRYNDYVIEASIYFFLIF